MGKMIARALLCGIAAILGWILTEPFLPKDFMSESWARQEGIMVTVVIASIGLIAGAHQGYLRGGSRNLWMGLALGGVLGSVGGHLGYIIGGTLSSALFGPAWTVGSFPIMPRTLTFLCLGGFLGLGIGSTQLNWRTMLSGLIGGLIGGGIAGLVFDPLGATLGAFQAVGDGRTETGTVSRAVMWALIGFNVGLFTALIENATRQAWVRLVVGKNEGREWPIDAPQTTIGRDERAHVPLFGDQNVAALHAVINRQDQHYVLVDPGTPIGVGINGARLTQPAFLNHGDTIMIAGHQLQFLMKSGAARRSQEGRVHGQPIMPQMPSGAGAPQAPIQQPQHTPAPQHIPTPQTAPMAQTQAFSPSQVPNPASAPGLTIVALTGPLTGQRYTISQPSEVGREGQGIPIAFDTQASRRHAVLQPTLQGLSVKDLQSTNGTYINGARVQEGIARPGDTIQIGSTQFKVE